MAVQGIKHISVQSSVSLQHLPYDVALETGLPKEIDSKLSFATQKLKEIVKAKTPSAKGGSLTDALPAVGEQSSPAERSCGVRIPLLLSRAISGTARNAHTCFFTSPLSRDISN